MSSFNSGGSRWSSERQRQERERQREAQKELMRKARVEREAKAKEEEASLAAERARATTTTTTTTPPPATPARPTTTSASASGETPSSSRSEVGRKWRSAVEPTESGGLPDIPEISGSRRGGGNRGSGISGRIMLFGGVLFLLMAIVAFLPFGPFGGGGSKPTPTPTNEVPVVVGPSTPSSNSAAHVVPTAPSDGSRVVCLDPGHGGWDYGYQRQWSEMTQQGPALNESELNLGMAYMLKAELEAQGITVVMTRTGGNAVNTFGEDVNGDGKTIFDGADDKERRQNGDWDEIQARINICNAAHADILVSLHINGTQGISDARGYEVYYTAAPYRPFGDLSHQLADDVYRRMYTSLNAAGYTGTARGVKDDTQLEAEKYEYGSAEHLLLTGPAIQTPNRTLHPSEMPGIIVEPIFLSNEDDANFIAQEKNQKLLVDAYAAGILDYFAANPG
ncbi:MAG: N-acetylmuramoyl-L-alanine amidase [Thermomicrobiales bacterium]